MTNASALLDSIRSLRRTVGAPERRVAVHRLRDILAEIASSYAAAFRRRRIEFALVLDDDLAVRVDAPTLRFHLLGNLLNNAIQSSPEGTTIEVEASREGDRARITLRNCASVHDVERLSRLMEGTCPPVQDERGHGLGLAIVRAYCLEAGYELRPVVTALGPGRALVEVTVLVPAVEPLTLPSMCSRARGGAEEW